jgi:hypothetical protein
MTLAEALQLAHLRPAGEPLDLSGLLSTLQHPPAQLIADNNGFGEHLAQLNKNAMAANDARLRAISAGGNAGTFSPSNWTPSASAIHSTPLPEHFATPQPLLYQNAMPPRGLL